MYNVDLGDFGQALGPRIRLTTGSYGPVPEATGDVQAHMAMQAILDIVEGIGGDVLESEVVELRESREAARYFGLVKARLPELPVEVTQWVIGVNFLDERAALLWEMTAGTVLNRMPGFSLEGISRKPIEGGERVSVVVKYKPDPANELFYEESEINFEREEAGGEELIPVPRSAAALRMGKIGLWSGLALAGIVVVGGTIAAVVAYRRGD